MPQSIASSRSTRSTRSSRKASISSATSDDSDSWTGSSDGGGTTKTGYTVAFNRYPLSGGFSIPKPISPPRSRKERQAHRRGKHSIEDKKALERQEKACTDAIALANTTYEKAKADADMAWYNGKIDIKTAIHMEKEAMKTRDRRIETMQAVWRGYRKDARTKRKPKRLPVDPVEMRLSERLAVAREMYEEDKLKVDQQVQAKKLITAERWDKKLINGETAGKELETIKNKMEPEYEKAEKKYEEHKQYIKDTHFYPEKIRNKLDDEWKRYTKELRYLDNKAEKKKREMVVRWHKGLFSLAVEVKKEERIQKRLAEECSEEKRYHEKNVEDIKDEMPAIRQMA